MHRKKAHTRTHKPVKRSEELKSSVCSQENAGDERSVRWQGLKRTGAVGLDRLGEEGGGVFASQAYEYG